MSDAAPASGQNMPEIKGAKQADNLSSTEKPLVRESVQQLEKEQMYSSVKPYAKAHEAAAIKTKHSRTKRFQNPCSRQTQLSDCEIGPVDAKVRIDRC